MPSNIGSRRQSGTSSPGRGRAPGDLGPGKPTKRASAPFLGGQSKKPRRSSGSSSAAGDPAEATVAAVAAVAPQEASSSTARQQRLRDALLSALFRQPEEDAAPSAGPGSAQPTAQVALKNVSVEYVRSMLFEVIRDGEVSESERKIMLWSIIVLAQLRDKCPDVRIPVPSSLQALGRYLETQGPAVRELLRAVQGGPNEGVRESVFAERSPRRRAWVGGLDADAGAPGGAAERAAVAAAERGLGWLVHLVGAGELVHQATPEELMLACEPPREVDLCARHGPVLGACLGSLGPIVPEAYMFRARAADFYRLCGLREGVDLDLLLLALRFFLAAFVYAQLKKLPAFIVGALYVRVFICTFDEKAWVLGRVVQLLRLMAEKATDWDKNDEWVGCPDDGSPSAIQWLPDRLASVISEHLTIGMASFAITSTVTFQHAYSAWELRAPIALAPALLAGYAAALLAISLDWVLGEILASFIEELAPLLFFPVARAILNYMFAVLLAKLLVRAMEIADEVVQPKLVFMSLKLGSRTRSASRVL